MSSFLTA